MAGPCTSVCVGSPPQAGKELALSWYSGFFSADASTPIQVDLYEGAWETTVTDCRNIAAPSLFSTTVPNSGEATITLPKEVGPVDGKRFYFRVLGNNVCYLGPERGFSVAPAELKTSSTQPPSSNGNDPNNPNSNRGPPNSNPIDPNNPFPPTTGNNPSSKSSNNDTVILIAAIVGGFLIIGILVLAAVWARKRQLRKLAESSPDVAAESGAANSAADMSSAVSNAGAPTAGAAAAGLAAAAVVPPRTKSKQRVDKATGTPSSSLSRHASSDTAPVPVVRRDPAESGSDVPEDEDDRPEIPFPLVAASLAPSAVAAAASSNDEPDEPLVIDPKRFSSQSIESIESLGSLESDASVATNPPVLDEIKVDTTNLASSPAAPDKRSPIIREGDLPSPSGSARSSASRVLSPSEAQLLAKAFRDGLNGRPK